MKYFVYAYRDKKLRCYDKPIYSTEDKEHVSVMTGRAVSKETDSNQLAKLKDMSLYYVGEFDDIKCKFKIVDEPEKLIDLEDYIYGKDTEIK